MIEFFHNLFSSGCRDIVILCELGVKVTVLLILNTSKNSQIKAVYRYKQGEAIYKISLNSVEALFRNKIMNVECFQTQCLVAYVKCSCGVFGK